MSLTVSVIEDEFPDAPPDVVKVRDGDYLIIVTDPAVEQSVVVYDGGKTHVITIKNRIV